MSVAERPDLYRPRRLGRRLMEPAFRLACLMATMVGVIVLAVLLGAVLVAALGHREELGRPPLRAGDVVGGARALVDSMRGLATRIQSTDAPEDGYRGGIVGTLWLLALVTALAIPVGVGAAIFLEEYVPEGRWRRVVQTNIANLAGVPSVVYGLLGLAAFTYAFGNDRLALGRTLWAGGLTLSLLVLPVVVISTQEALRTVPNSLRSAALALGATRWQMVWGHVLPSALPGIMTGTILALSRAIGETAPLILVGAATSLFVIPRRPGDPYTALPVEIYADAKEPGEEFQAIAAGGILILLAILLTMNAAAILIRNRAGRHRR